MKIATYSVTNFRSITTAHKLTLSNITALIGKNNEGKTNILKSLAAAMQLLKAHATLGDKRTRRLSLYASFSRDIYDWKRDFPIHLQSRNSEKQTIFRIEFSFNDSEITELKELVGVTINGLLAIEMKIGENHDLSIRPTKQGRVLQSLSDNFETITKFIAERINFNYIPAVRTDLEALSLIEEMLGNELKVLETDARYIQALETIKQLQQPILIELASRIKQPLIEFIPTIKNVSIEIQENTRRFALRRDCKVIIDDGISTNIEYKGDGVKSLATLGLLINRNAKPGVSILAIEEPESHLHPSAIHQINDIIRNIANTSQVIISTHNPLFVDRVNIKSNILVNDGKARSAKTISEIRDLLGIKASDNLTNANFALVVEGEEDVISLQALLPSMSQKIAKAMKDNILIIESLSGAGNLSYKLSLLKSFLCQTYTLLDGDEAGKSAYQKAETAKLISSVNCTMITCSGFQNAEFEDCIAVDTYKQAIIHDFGVDLEDSAFRGSRKWSDRIKSVFQSQSKPWDDKTLTRVKFTVAKCISESPSTALHQHHKKSIIALVTGIENMLSNTSKF